MRNSDTVIQVELAVTVAGTMSLLDAHVLDWVFETLSDDGNEPHASRLETINLNYAFLSI